METTAFVALSNLKLEIRILLTLPNWRNYMIFTKYMYLAKVSWNQKSIMYSPLASQWKGEDRQKSGRYHLPVGMVQTVRHFLLQRIHNIKIIFLKIPSTRMIVIQRPNGVLHWPSSKFYCQT